MPERLAPHEWRRRPQRERGLLEKLGYLLLAGITNGSVYGLVGLSLSIIYGSSRVINFAQGDFVMLGAMSAVMFVVTAALPWPLAMVATIVVALALDYLVYRPLARRKAPPLTIMMGTLGAAIVIYGAALLVGAPISNSCRPFFHSTRSLSARSSPIRSNWRSSALSRCFCWRHGLCSIARASAFPSARPASIRASRC